MDYILKYRVYKVKEIVYDVIDKLGFFEATVEYDLRKEELRDGFIEYLKL